ncbi:vacuolar protein sorting-associated protein 53 A [Tanacetum coccineum]
MNSDVNMFSALATDKEDVKVMVGFTEFRKQKGYTIIDLNTSIPYPSSTHGENDTIKLIRALHKFVGPNIKVFLSDVFHNLLPTDIYSLVVDALEPSVKDELLKNFCDKELISYHQIFEGAVFGIPSELAKLDKTEMGYAWLCKLNRILATFFMLEENSVELYLRFYPSSA